MNKTPAHPDDHMTVSISLAFQAKRNPDVDGPPPLFAVEIEQTFGAAEATDYLEQVISAIRERRLFGFTPQQQAESAVSVGDWIKKTTQEVIAANTSSKAGQKFATALKAEHIKYF